MEDYHIMQCLLSFCCFQVQFEYHKDAIVILRFLGTSPDSSNLRRLLRSICSQILYNTVGKAGNVPEDFDELVVLFHGLLDEYKSDNPLVIILDSLDQLNEDHSSYKLRWLPRKLKSNVRILLSTYIETLEIVTNLKALFNPKSFTIVPTLGEELGFQILKVWLEGSSRTLTSEQYDIVQKAFHVCSLPLYVKLVFENILMWKSFTPLNKCILQSTLQESISTLFGQLENKHGRMFVERAFAYVTASASGLSELELEDVMSIDDTLLTEVFKFQLPPVRRIPSLLWVRLKYDVQKYIVDKEIDETRVTFWYHRQFIEASQERYLKDGNFSAEIHSNLADYFLGKWFNVPKPFRYTAEQAKKYGMSSLDSSADRKVADQPIKFMYTDKEGNVQIRYNKRKLSKLPFHLAHANREDELNSICLYNYHFVIAKIKATSVIQVLSDFIHTKVRNPPRSSKSSVLERVLKSSQSTLQQHPDSLALEVCGHMLSYLADKKPSPEKTLVSECLKVSDESQKPIPYMMCYNVPSEALLYKMENHKLSYGCLNVATSKDGKHLVALGENNVVFFWDLMVGELECEIQALNPEECKLNIMGIEREKDLVYLSSTYQKAMHPFVIINIQTSEIEKSLSLGKSYPAVGMADSLKHVMVGQRIFCLHKGHSADVFSLQTGQHEHTFDISADDMIISSDKKLAVFHLKSSTVYAFYSVSSWEELHQLDVNGPSLSLCLSPTTHEAFVLMKDSGLVHMVNTNKDDGTIGQVLSRIKTADGQKIREVSLSTSTNYLILMTEDGLLLWNYKSSKLFKQFRIPNAVQPDHRVLDFFSTLLPDDKTLVVGYEGHLIVWDVTSGSIKACLEASKSKITFLDVNNKRNLAITTSKRNNAVQIWNLDAMGKVDSKFRPMTMRSSPRYMEISKTGDIALVRGTTSNDVVIVDLINGRMKMAISEAYEIIQPVITPDGTYAVLREYHGENVIKIWSTENGNLLSSLPLSSLRVKHYKCSNSRVVVKSDQENSSTFSFWDVKTGKLLYDFSVDYLNIGEIILELTHSDDEILISKNQKGEDVGTCDLLLVNIKSGKELLTLTGINPSRIQPIGSSGHLFFGEQTEGETQYLIVIDTKARKVVKREKTSPMPTSFISLDRDGNYGIDRVLNLYDLTSMKHVHQFDPEYKDVMQKNVKTKATAPKMMPNGEVAVWLNIRAGLVKVGNIKERAVQSVFSVHSIPISLGVSPRGLIMIGCEDGRLMLLQVPDSSSDTREGRLTVLLNEVTNRLTMLSKDIYSGLTNNNKTQNKKSSVCSII